MQQFFAIGVYQFGASESAFGVWGQTQMAIGSRHVLVDVRITSATLNETEADNLARQIHAAQGQSCELLPF